MPRELHRKAGDAGPARRRASPRRSAARAATCVDAVVVCEEMFEAGASSGADGRAVHRRHRAAAHRRPRATRPRSTGSCGRPWPARLIGVAGGHRARRRLRRRRHPDHARVRDGDHYVVNGAKTFITSGVRADFVTTAVRTGGPGPRGRLAAGRREGHARVHRRPRLAKMGWHCSDTAELSFADVRVPAANLVGAENTGFAQIAAAVRRRADRAGRARLRHRARCLALTVDVVPRPRDVRQAADLAARSVQTRWSRCAGGSRSPGPTPARVVERHARRRGGPDRRGLPRQEDRGRGRRVRGDRPCSCTAAPATCTGPRWSGTTATPGSWPSAEARPRC